MKGQPRSAVSRRRFLARSAGVAAAVMAGDVPPTSGASWVPAAPTAAPDRPLQQREPVRGILDALARHSLVAITERHMLQEWHDFMTGLLRHPGLPGKVDAIVVEFGNAAYQDVADRFVLSDEPVLDGDLRQIWRQIGDPTWNAPVYEQFFRTVRSLNWTLPASHRIRVVLGQPPVTMAQVLAHPTDRTLVRTFVQSTVMNAHFADVVEREVLRKGGRALLIAGGGHTLRGLRDDNDPHRLNAASLIARRHPGALYVVDLLVLPPGRQPGSLERRTRARVAHWPRPALASLAGTWLGATTKSGQWINSMAYRATDAHARRYDNQADAVLYLGPGERLTASRPDPAMYHWGSYASQLRRLGPIISPVYGEQIDVIAVGLKAATAAPSWFAG